MSVTGVRVSTEQRFDSELISDFNCLPELSTHTETHTHTQTDTNMSVCQNSYCDFQYLLLLALQYLAEISLLARHGITLQLVAGTVDINAVVRQYCCNTETKDQARLYQFMRDLIACRDWYDRDSGCILSRDELCDIINFFGC